MANVKITELTAATALAGTDVLPIVDVGADATKKVSVSDLLRNVPDGTASAPALAFADDQNTGVLSPGDNSLAFATSGTQRLVIDGSGNVGIGGTATNYANHKSLALFGSGSTAAGLLQFTDASGNADAAIFADDGSLYINADYDNTTSNSSIRFRVDGSSAEKMRIDSSGNVGIGTTSPGASLEISNSTANAAKLRVKRSNSHSNHIELGTNGGESQIVANGVTGVNGSLIFARDSDTGTPTESARIDSSGNVGVGITPTANLHVSGTIQAQTGSTVAQMFTDGGSAYFTSVGAFPMLFQTNGSERMRLDSSGNVGIGTSSPQRALVVSDAGDEGFEFFPGSSDTGNTLNHYDRGSSAFIDITTNADQHIFGRADGEKMRIDSSGRLLVATTSSTANSNADDLQIGARTDSGERGITVASSAAGSIRFADNGNDTAGYIFYSHSDNSLRLGANGAERMRIDSSGRVLINRTSVFSSEKLSVVYAPANRGMVIDTDSTFTGNSNIIEFRANGTLGGSITFTNNGTTTAYVTSSDYRLKENVVDLGGAIARVKQLSPKRFNFIVDADTTVDGFLAHEAQTVVPEAVTGTHNEVDDDNNPVYQGIDQSKLVPLLTAALQEAIAKIETLETKVAALEAQ